jgi:dihydroorotase
MLTIKNAFIASLGKFDIIIEGNKIKDVLPSSNENRRFDIDASGLWAAPGFIDLHAHFREPGFRYKETIQTASEAAAAGGFASVCPMPNVDPAIDSPEKFDVYKDSPINIFPVMAPTLGNAGKVLSDGFEFAAAISDDGIEIMDSRVMLEAMIKTKNAGKVFMAHCEDLSLKGDINERVAEKFGLAPIPNESEDIMIARNILLNRKIGGRLHICHVATKGGVELIRDAKARGDRVTAEATPHHFSLCDEDITENSGKFKMSPPLRSREDTRAIREALKDGTIDAIATDHAPHSIEEKSRGFETAPNGIPGLETAFALAFTNLDLTPEKLIEKFTVNPARILGINNVGIKISADADIVLLDLNSTYTIEAKNFKSKCKVSPFDGMKVRGKVVCTIVKGKIIYTDF